MPNKHNPNLCLPCQLLPKSPRKTQDWFQRPTSRKMSQQDSFSDGEFEAAIAAAAYAITSAEERESTKKQRGSSVKFSPGESLPKTKSRNEDTKIKLNSFRGSFKRWFSDPEAKEDETPGVSGDSFTRNSSTAEQMNVEDSSANQHRITDKAMGSTPNVTKTPTFTDKYLNDTGNKRVESGKEMIPGLQKAPTTKFPSSPFGNRTQGGYSPAQTKAEAMADAWEKEQMLKIRDRYDKMMSTIVEWENEKKAKAKRCLERKQREPEQSRARALQKYQDEISRVEKVAGEARALAEERKRNDETKARVKAGNIRSTGKIPRACRCC